MELQGNRNKDRSWEGGEYLPKDSMCVVTLGKDKAKFGFKDLPVQIVNLIYYKQSELTSRQLFSKYGILKELLDGESWDPYHTQPQSWWESTTGKLDKKHTITPSEAYQKYLQIGGKHKSCRCQTDCSKSKSCKCREWHKLYNKYCHQRQETWCVCCVSEVNKYVMIWSVGCIQKNKK